jgi:hypothetical protein
MKIMKITGLKIVGLLIMLGGIGAGSAAAAPIYWSGNGHYYDIVYSPGIEWNVARVAAAGSSYNGLTGHLVTFTSAAEESYVMPAFAELFNPAEPYAPFFLIGAYQPASVWNTAAEPGGGWRWVTGETWDYTNWAGGEPNNFDNNEHVAQTWKHGSDPDFTGWNDINDPSLEFVNGYIVEYEAVPEPATFLTVLGGLGLLGMAHRRLGKTFGR